MIILCSNCNKKFEISSDLIPSQGRLLECSSCNHKWFFKKEIIDESLTSVKINKPREDLENPLEDVETPLEDVETPLEDVETPKEGVETSQEKIVPFKDEADSLVKIENLKNIELLDKTTKDNFIKKKPLNTNKEYKKNDYNILNSIAVCIISFIAIIIILDTFQLPISKIIPNIEFLLYNLYESINDIVLFFNDLI